MKLEAILTCLFLGVTTLSSAVPAAAATQAPQGQDLLVGKPAWEVFNTPDTNGMLMILLGTAYKDVKLRLSTSGVMVRDGSWTVGSGNAPHAGGEDEAAIAIDMDHRQVMAAALFGGKQLRLYGGNDIALFPPKLQEWVKSRQAVAAGNSSNGSIPTSAIRGSDAGASTNAGQSETKSSSFCNPTNDASNAKNRAIAARKSLSGWILLRTLNPKPMCQSIAESAADNMNQTDAISNSYLDLENKGGRVGAGTWLVICNRYEFFARRVKQYCEVK